MGAERFWETIEKTTQKKRAFNKLVKQAEYEYGHSGYTGSIAEKPGFIFVPLVVSRTAEEVDSIIEDSPDDPKTWVSLFGKNSEKAYEAYDNKWEDCLCFDAVDYTVFTGYASS